MTPERLAGFVEGMRAAIEICRARPTQMACMAAMEIKNQADYLEGLGEPGDHRRAATTEEAVNAKIRGLAAALGRWRQASPPDTATEDLARLAGENRPATREELQALFGIEFAPFRPSDYETEPSLKEGWAVFDSGEEARIKKFDEIDAFLDDEGAWGFVVGRAAEGSRRHIAALAIISGAERGRMAKWLDKRRRKLARAHTAAASG
jgi:hypothetical protein